MAALYHVLICAYICVLICAHICVLICAHICVLIRALVRILRCQHCTTPYMCPYMCPFLQQMAALYHAPMNADSLSNNPDLVSRPLFLFFFHKRRLVE